MADVQEWYTDLTDATDLMFSSNAFLSTRIKKEAPQTQMEEPFVATERVSNGSGLVGEQMSRIGHKSRSQT